MREQKITFGEMRSGGGPTGIMVYCADHRCSHSVAMAADQWPDHVRLSDIEPRFVCRVRQARRGRQAALRSGADRYRHKRGRQMRMVLAVVLGLIGAAVAGFVFGLLNSPSILITLGGLTVGAAIFSFVKG